jgi:predicted nuclease with TOPRIM domain
VRHEPTLDFEAEMYLILKSLKDDVSEIRQRLKRLEDKVNEEEQERIADKWNSIKMMGER